MSVVTAPAQTVRQHLILLDGQWVESSKRGQVISPWNSQPVADVYEATAEQAHSAGEAARKVMPAMRALTAAQRAEALRKIVAGIVEHAEEFAAIIRDEVGKPLNLARVEVQRAARTFQIASEEALRLPGEIVYPDTEPQGAGMVGRVQSFPLGPILGITPFNFPLNLVAHKVAPALAAGCPIVIKPPPQGPGAALLLGRIVLESGLPPAALQVLPGGLDAGQALCASDAFLAVSFTGSGKAGWTIKKNALPRQKVLLELGGNAPVIIDESADLEAAAKNVAMAGYIYSGQVCISTQRVIVLKNAAQTFERKLAEKILLDVSISASPADEKAVVGPLIDKNAADRIEQWTSAALKRGARALVRGERKSERLITPWLMENVPADEPLACEEAFGPVLTYTVANDFAEAVAIANQSKYGLQASVFSNALKNVEFAYRELEVGCVLVNAPTAFRLDSQLYGGVKDSGFGREGVKEVVRVFTEPKLLVVKP